MRFFIIGAGLGQTRFLTREAEDALKASDAVFTTSRLARLSEKTTICPYHKLAEQAIRAQADTVALLVSGDVGFFSMARELRKKLQPYGTVELFCGISSMQYFCAKLGIAYNDALCVRSLHGRTGSILGAVSYRPLVFVLTGGERTAASVCQTLCKAGLGGLTIHIGEALGGERERILSGAAYRLAARTYDDLTVMLIENPQYVHAWEPVRDTMFQRGKVPMTKEEIRWTALGYLAVQPEDTVWDIGAGTGGMTATLARRAYDGLVYAIERNPLAITLLEDNRRKLGGYNIQIVAASAPKGLTRLPRPDCIFIGGGGGHIREILALAKEKNPLARVVITAISLETLQEGLNALRELDFDEISVSQISASRGRIIGAHTLMLANNPVFLLYGGGKQN